MFKNYFKTAWRNLWKNKFYTGINMLGLATGLTTAILLMLWIQDEKGFDRFYKDYERIYHLSAHFDVGGKPQVWTGVPGPLSVYARSVPQIESAVRIKDDWGVSLRRPDNKQPVSDLHTAFVDSSFFSIFDVKILSGNEQNILPDINSVLLTKSTAKKIFGTDDATGKIVMQDSMQFMVSGILEDFPLNSSLRFDALFPMSRYAKMFTGWGGNGDWKTIDEDLGNYAFNTFVKLQPGTDATGIGSALSQKYKDVRNGTSQTIFMLQPLADMHLISADGNKSALRMVQVFSVITILLLVIAAINYVNLSTARAMSRAKEVSMRKIVGASKAQLFFQFATETMVIFLIAGVAALLFTWLLVPAYNNISGKSIVFSLANPIVWLLITAAIIGTLMLASIYPALHLSSFKPIQSLKGKINQSVSNILLRKILVIFQFTISVMLIICTLVINGQIKYIRTMNPGYDKEHVFVVQLNGDAVNHADVIKKELSGSPGILGASVSGVYDITNFGNATGDIDWPGKPADLHMITGRASVDKEFIPLMNFTFLEGENFAGTPSDTAAFIINETLAREMGLQPPYVGKRMSLHETPGVIKGVLKDFNFKSLREKIGPMVFWTSRWKGTLYVKTTGAGAREAIQAVEDICKRYPSETPFAYNFLDAKFDELYRSENRSQQLFSIFAGIAIFISCLGLFALATYSAQLKTKEIGVRKVLGASVANIVKLLGKDFILLVILAIVIAVPLAWYAMDKWLENFAYKTNIGWGLFVAAGLIAIGIAVFTISFQAVKAALANPVKALRTE